MKRRTKEKKSASLARSDRLIYQFYLSHLSILEQRRDFQNFILKSGVGLFKLVATCS